MSQKTNLPIINPQTNFDQRVQDYFNNYYGTPVQVTDNEYSETKSFFMARTGNNEASAAALTAATIQAANELGVFILDIISEFKNSGDLKSAVPTFLNMSRRSSSLLGYDVALKPSENIARQVEA